MAGTLQTIQTALLLVESQSATAQTTVVSSTPSSTSDNGETTVVLPSTLSATLDTSSTTATATNIIPFTTITATESHEPTASPLPTLSSSSRSSVTFTSPTSISPSPTAQTKCEWRGHCLGDPCETYNDCDNDWICTSGKCTVCEENCGGGFSAGLPTMSVNTTALSTTFSTSTYISSIINSTATDATGSGSMTSLPTASATAMATAQSSTLRTGTSVGISIAVVAVGLWYRRVRKRRRDKLDSDTSNQSPNGTSGLAQEATHAELDPLEPAKNELEAERGVELISGEKSLAFELPNTCRPAELPGSGPMDVRWRDGGRKK